MLKYYSHFLNNSLVKTLLGMVTRLTESFVTVLFLLSFKVSYFLKLCLLFIIFK